ncbi:tissue factor pathway inhibitor 2-like isoform X1 [Podarcis muralis]
MGQAAGNSRAFLRAAAFVVLLGRVRLQIPTADNRELCLESPVPGVCPGSFDRWYYNRASQDCQRFTHGGCLGNENNFLSFDACIETCGKIKKVPVMCRVKPPQGTWSPLKPKYFFNLETMKCEEFFPKKRSRHPNMFSSQRSCTDVCKLGRKSPSYCSSPKDVGLCSASLRRFYYNIASRTCVAFNYTGCGGNNNNFLTKKDCMDACKHVQVNEVIKLPPIVIQFLFFS